MRKIFAIFLALLTSASLALADCHCKHAHRDDTTRWGGNIFEIQIEKNPVKLIRGVVVIGDIDNPLSGALVEVFTHPEYLLNPESHPPTKPKQHRVAACITAKDGRFCFSGLEPGAYEIRTSVNQGVDVTHLYVEFDPYSSRKDDLVAVLHIGT